MIDLDKKVAVITDSNSGITQAQAKELGIRVLPMPFMINEETFFEDITLTQEEFYEKLEGGADVVTSQPSPEAVMELWREVLKEYDETTVTIEEDGGNVRTFEKADIALIRLAFDF